MSRLVVHRKAAKYLTALPRPLRERIKEALTQLSASPLAYPVATNRLSHCASEDFTPHQITCT